MHTECVSLVVSIQGMAEKCRLAVLAFCCDNAPANQKMVQLVRQNAPANILVELACLAAAKSFQDHENDS